MSNAPDGSLGDQRLSGPPGLNGTTTNGHAIASAKAESPLDNLDEIVRQAVQDEIDKQVTERVTALWEKGRKAMTQSAAKHDRQLEELLSEVKRCEKRQQDLEEENKMLKQALHTLADRFAAFGTIFGAAAPAAGGKEASNNSHSPPKEGKQQPAAKGEPEENQKLWNVDSAERKRAWVLHEGAEASSVASTSATPHALTSSLADLLESGSSSRSQRGGESCLAEHLPPVPPFPLDIAKHTGIAAASSSQPLAAPLSLADALGPPTGASPATSAAQSAPTPLSLATSLPPVAPVLPPGLEASPVPSVAETLLSLYNAAGYNAKGFTTFNFTLRRADDVELGLTVSPTDDNKALRVEAIREEGAVESWNRQCANNFAHVEKSVKPGDMIVGVNSVTLDADGMLGQCKDKQLLKIAILRSHLAIEDATLISLYEQDQAAANGAGASHQMRAEAAAFVPMSSGNSEEAESPKEKADATAAAAA